MPPAISRYSAFFASLSVTVAAVAGFWWSLPLYFVGDDFAYVWRFTSMNWSNWPHLFVREWSEGIWGNPLRELRPIAALSFLIDGRLWGGTAAGYHLTNLLLHITCSLVVMLTARDVLKRGWLPAVAAGALFAAHPGHVEAVTWITGRADLLGALGCLTGFYGIVRFRVSDRKAWLALSWSAYFAGIFSKEFCLVLPLLVIVYDLFFTRPAPVRLTRLLLPYAGFVILALVYYWCRTQAMGPQLGAPALEWWTKDFWRQVAQREMIYLGELLWPLASWLPVANEQRRFALQLLLRIVGAVLAGAAVLWWADRRKGAADARAALFFLIAWFLLATLPFVVTYVSARHLYLASAGVCLGLVAILARFIRQPVGFALVALALVVGCEWRLHERSESWRRAARLSAEITDALAHVAGTSVPGEALIINVPTLSGDAWLWSWASPFALRPPFQNRDIWAELIVLEERGVYFRPGDWEKHVSIPKLRDYSGPAWLITAGDRVETRHVSGEDFAMARQTLGAPLEAPGSFERLVAALASRP